MKNNYYELKISTTNEFEKEIIISFLMDNICNGVEERKNKIFVRSEEDLAEAEDKIKEFCKNLKFTIKTDLVIKKNQDWIESYKKGVKPIEVGKFYIYPSWEKEREGLINIKIDPALAFGSGHHESTNGCLKVISELDIKEGNIALDVGTGSGILAIALAKRGALVDFCDTDEIAIEATKTNFKQNCVKYENFWLGSADKSNKSYNIVIANIIADILIIIKKDLKRVTREGGYLILSGILDRYVDLVKKNFDDLTLIKEIKQNEWNTITFKKENNE